MDIPSKPQQSSLIQLKPHRGIGRLSLTDRTFYVRTGLDFRKQHKLGKYEEVSASEKNYHIEKNSNGDVVGWEIVDRKSGLTFKYPRDKFYMIDRTRKTRKSSICNRKSQSDCASNESCSWVSGTKRRYCRSKRKKASLTWD